MSDEFDKEAEREKLREKFAEDEEKRSETRRMSELLLQGATMTNNHCDSCGDPLFRQNGQTFCPTCADGGAEAAEQPQPGAEQRQPGAGQNGEEPQPAQGRTPAPETDRGTGAERPESGAATGTQGEGTGQRSPQQLPENAEVIAQAGGKRGGAPSEPRQPAESTGQHGSPQPPEGGSSGEDPRAELRRAVTETARKASAATDPRTARAWLEASKEAAEALAALER